MTYKVNTQSNKRLLVDVLQNPAIREKLYCIHPVLNDLNNGWREITYGDLHRAVDYLSWWITDRLGPEEKQTVGYLGANDIRYAVFVLACIKTGHVGLLLSTRNSQQAFRHLFDRTESTKLLFTGDKTRLVNDIQSNRAENEKLETFEIPTLRDIFAASPEPYPFDKKYADVEDQPVIIVHSSGTTGFPKPVYITHGYVATLDNMKNLPLPPGRKHGLFTFSAGQRRRLNTSPFFHFVGIVALSECIFFETPLVVCPDRHITIDLLQRIMDEAKPEWMLTTPSLLEDFTKTPEGLEVLSRFHRIDYGGAPMRAESAKILSKRVQLQTALGSTETGYTGTLFCGGEESDVLEFNPYFGVKLEDTGDGVYEIVIPRQEHRDFHGIFHTMPDLQEYHTGDLVIPHGAEGKWKYYGRRDDVIVLSNGEKFNPIEMEKMVETHPLVSKAVVVGQGRFDAALLVQPHWNEVGDDADSAILEKIMPAIDKMNTIAPGHGRVLPNRVILGSREKPFKVSPKNTIQRKMILADYKDEIDQVYTNNEIALVAELPRTTAYEDIRRFIRATISHLAKIEDINEEQSIFTMGLDSLHALQLSQTLQTAARHLQPKEQSEINSQHIYTNPSVNQLSQFFHSLVTGHHPISPKSNRSSKITDLIDRFSRGFGQKHTVLLTGSTGSLGSYILHELLLDMSIVKIYSLNRSPDADRRQLESFTSKGLSIHPSQLNKIEYVHSNLGEENLGLDEFTYKKMTASVDTIIHNAWMVNFNYGVEAFEYPHLAGVRRLIEFVLESPRRPHLHFISSVSTAGAWNVDDSPTIPENIVHNPDIALRQGYGESKYIAERMCEAASTQCGISTSIHRVGQLGGPTSRKGMWNKQEWVPSLIHSSKTIGKIPESLGALPVDWVPIDMAARIVIDIVHTSHGKGSCGVFHVVNPSPSDWSSLIPTIQRFCHVTPISLEDWINTLQSDSSGIQDRPALKLLDFFKGIQGSGKGQPLFEVKQSKAASKKMRELPPIDGAIMDNWMRQWGFK
ncbi:hypothetical protein MW887_000714 [Aspergillus wentii]|nr:hypothetical protein MW887_000714 [Aspergillus wentii]